MTWDPRPLNSGDTIAGLYIYILQKIRVRSLSLYIYIFIYSIYIYIAIPLGLESGAVGCILEQPESARENLVHRSPKPQPAPKTES